MVIGISARHINVRLTFDGVADDASEAKCKGKYEGCRPAYVTANPGSVGCDRSRVVWMIWNYISSNPKANPRSREVPLDNAYPYDLLGVPPHEPPTV